MAIQIEAVKAEGMAVDIDRLAANGFESISEADRFRLKHQGVCAQRQVGVFMMRIRVPGGRLSAPQLRRVAQLAERYGHASVHVTTRAGLELHHVRIESVTPIWDALADVGLTTKGSCGDTLRNVIACAHGEGFAGQVLPTMPFVRLLHDHIVAISDDTNVSRKVNVAIACSPECDAHVATSDIGFVATADPFGGPPSFAVWGAGGLGATPRLAIEMRRSVPQDELIPAFDALVALCGKYTDRSSRAKAKLKMVVEKRGPAEVRALFDEEFAAAKARGDHASAVFDASPVAGRNAELLSVLVPMGEIGAHAVFGLADVAERYGGGDVLLTPDQNVEIPNVRRENVLAATRAVEAIGLQTQGRGSVADVVSCVGLEYCPLAVAHSMSLGEALSQTFAPLFDEPRYRDFRIHVSGCPHSCAKHQVADIGLSGAVTEWNGRRVEAYVLYVGGNAHERRLGIAFPTKIPRPMIFPVVAALLHEFERHGRDGERFSQTVARVGIDAFFQVVADAFDGSGKPIPERLAS